MSRTRPGLLVLSLAALLLLVGLESDASAQRTWCPAGHSWSTMLQRCVKVCPRGFYYSHVTGTCKRRTARYRSCPRGHYWSHTRRGCVKYRRCPKGYYYSFALGRCKVLKKACGYGHYYDVYTRRCRPRCPAGWVWKGTRCARKAVCPAGMRFNGNRCVRVVCPAGMAWNGSRCARAAVCPAGMAWNGTRCVTAAAPVRAAPRAMSAVRFRTLLAAIKKQAFSNSKISVLSTASGTNHFTCRQVATLLRAFTYSTDKIKALRLVARRIVDHSNSFVIYPAFTYSSSKAKARKILAAARPRR